MTPMLLLPGAWMGGWIWDATVERLQQAGCSARTVTLPGLEPGTANSSISAVGLNDHVDYAVREVRAIGRPLTIVGHSYSGVIAGMVADREPELVAHTVIVAGFFPRHGRCLLDDWGADPEERAAERADIEQAAMMWAPPPVEGVAADPGLDSDQARWLGRRLQPHPGRTVLEPASMSRPITEQSVTVIANVGEGDPVATLPADLADTDLTKWNFREIAEGHWPMLGCPTRLDEVLLESATLAASERPEPEIELGTPADSRFGGGS